MDRLKRRDVDIRFGFVPLPEGEARTKKLWVRVSPKELREVQARAAAEKTEVCDWARIRMLGA